MLIGGILLFMIMIIFALALPVVQVPTMSPPAAVKTVSPNERSARRQDMLVMVPISGRCGNDPLDISRVQTPMADLVWSTSSNADQTVELRFRIDENGRPLGITRDPVGYGMMADLTPSLAASRFAPNAMREGCTIVYQPKRSSIPDADIHALIDYSIFAQSRPPKELFERVAPAGSDCSTRQSAVLLRGFPDFEKIPATPGRSNWSMVQFDINDAGKPVRLKIYRTTGNVALDKASLNAVAQSRFAKGAKQGCLYPYTRRSGTLTAPESKEIAAYRPEDSDCPQTVEWKSQPTLVYPENFRRRYIEGWAVIAFDLAPWGAVGNTKVVAAEPAAEFGEAAQRIVLGSTTAASKQGYSNCVVKVRYAMQKQDRSAQVNFD
jgi:hypothetical protein